MELFKYSKIKNNLNKKPSGDVITFEITLNFFSILMDINDYVIIRCILFLKIQVKLKIRNMIRKGNFCHSPIND